MRLIILINVSRLPNSERQQQNEPLGFNPGMSWTNRITLFWSREVLFRLMWVCVSVCGCGCMCVCGYFWLCVCVCVFMIFMLLVTVSCVWLCVCVSVWLSMCECESFGCVPHAGATVCYAEQFKEGGVAMSKDIWDLKFLIWILGEYLWNDREP